MHIEIHQSTSPATHLEIDHAPAHGIDRTLPVIYDWKEHDDPAINPTFVTQRQEQMDAEIHQRDFVDTDTHVVNGAAIVRAAKLLPVERTKITLPLGPEAARTFHAGLAHEQHRIGQIAKHWPGNH